MKRRKIVLVGVFAFIILTVGALVLAMHFLQDKNIYNVTEKKYMIDNKSTRISINVANDANIFGRDGKGVFYDFLADFKEENSLDFNIVTSSIDNDFQGLSLTKGTVLPASTKVFYTDHFVLVAHNREEIG
ncbi:MAG TPA: hypothetical protein DCY94_05350, partial [Firmicutes bacterium]|nr:hypothetical protein [Bacillota bacterium]